MKLDWKTVGLIAAGVWIYSEERKRQARIKKLENWLKSKFE